MLTMQATSIYQVSLKAAKASNVSFHHPTTSIIDNFFVSLPASEYERKSLVGAMLSHRTRSKQQELRRRYMD